VKVNHCQKKTTPSGNRNSVVWLAIIQNMFVKWFAVPTLAECGNFEAPSPRNREMPVCTGLLIEGLIFVAALDHYFSDHGVQLYRVVFMCVVFVCAELFVQIQVSQLGILARKSTAREAFL
jgi:hypothetical protein